MVPIYYQNSHEINQSPLFVILIRYGATNVSRMWIKSLERQNL